MNRTRILLALALSCLAIAACKREAEAPPAGEDEQAADAARQDKPKKSSRASPARETKKTASLNPNTQTPAATAA